MSFGTFGFNPLFEGTYGSGVPGVWTPPRRIATMLWLNDTPLERYGLVLQRASNLLHNVTRAAAAPTMYPGLTGGQHALLQTVEPKTIGLEGYLLDVALEDVHDTLRALDDAFTDLIEVRTPYAPDRVMVAKAGPARADAIEPDREFVRPDAMAFRVSVELTCADAAAYAQVPRRMRLDQTLRDVVQGDLPSGGEIVLNGPMSGAIDLECYSPGGVLLDVLALRGVALASEDEYARILLDHPHAIVKRALDGTTTNVLHWRSLTDSTRWWKPSTRHVDRTRNQWCRMRLSSGDGWYVYLPAYVR